MRIFWGKRVYPPSHNVPAIEVAHKSAHHEASSIIPSMPRHVVETFSLLQRSPEVQVQNNTEVLGSQDTLLHEFGHGFCCS